MKRIALLLLTAGTACGAAASSPSTDASRSAASSRDRKLFVQSAVENGDDTVTLPLYEGRTRDGRTVWYVIFDSSSGDDAKEKGVNRSQKLANARGSGAVQKVDVDASGTVVFRASVIANPDGGVVPGPTGFPPQKAVPSSLGEDGYSPLIELPDGTIENAPHVANGTGDTIAWQHQKVVSIASDRRTVTLRETQGFSGGKAVLYVSTDASAPDAAALEESTFVPALNDAPTLGGDGTDSSRTSLAAFVNGQTGPDNPQRQGLNSALLDGLSPLNVLRWNPSQGRYSPLWDVHAAAWTEAAIAAGKNLRQDDFGDILGLASKGLVTAPDGGPFAASGFIVNCPIVSEGPRDE